MSRLEDLYNAQKTLEREHLTIDERLEKQMESLEEDIIKEEILPALSNDIAPRLKPIQRDLVLVVEYHPNEPISVALSRKAKISEIVGTKTLTPYSSTPVKSNVKPEKVEPHEPTKYVENATKGMRVTFTDGTVVWHRVAIDTFIETLKIIGLEKIAKLDIKHGPLGMKYNLVGKEKRETEPGRIWQHECDGWYIYSNISNIQKEKDLRKISDKLHLGLKIEEGKPE